MKTLKKLVRLFLLIVILGSASEMLSSCSHSYANYKKLSYSRRGGSSVGYRSKYQKKFKRNTVAIHQNYIIKNKRRTTYHY